MRGLFCAHVLAATYLLLGPKTAAAEVEFSFVQSPRTGLHIAVQPKPDYHRVHCLMRIRNGVGQKVFARVRCWNRPSDALSQATEEATVSHVFELQGDNDLWSSYLRVPRFGRQTATYQLEVGVVNVEAIDVQQVQRTYVWEIRRDAQGRGRMETVDVDAVPITVRRAVYAGGMVRIVMQKRLNQNEPGILAQVTQQDANRPVDGDQLAEKVN